MEHRLNIFDDVPDMSRLCDALDLGSIIRIPLLTGVLAGRWHRGDSLPAADRRSNGFEDERFLRMLDRAESLRLMLTQEGRTYVQTALAWIWTRSSRAVPVPGFRTAAQAVELALAMRHGPLSHEALERVAEAMRSSLQSNVRVGLR